MPVGKVFNAAENQVLISPVSSYYQGKAIRAQQQEAEQMSELRGLQIEEKKTELADAPNKKKQALELYDAQMQKIKQSNDLAEIELGAASLSYMAKRLAPAMMQSTEMGMSGDVKGGLAHFESEIEKIASDDSTPDAIKKKLEGMSGSDRVWQPEELARAKMAVGEWLDREGLKREPRNVLVDGNPSVVMIDDAGNAFEEDGTPVTGKVTPFATNEGGVIGGGLSKAGLNSTTVAFREQVKQASAGASTATELVKISYDSPAAMAKSGSVITFGNELFVTAKNLMNAAAPPALPKSETSKQDKGAEAFDWGDVDSKMKGMGVTTEDAARWKSGVYSIAFSAAVGEQGSRPSDKDIQAYIEIYGGQITDPNAFRATISQAMRRQYNMLKFTAELNPEITDRKQSLSVFENEYNKFLEAIDSGDIVEDGWRFLGGDKGDKNNWVKE